MNGSKSYGVFKQGTMAGFLDLSPISMTVISNKSILILPLRHTQGPQGCQNIHKNISKMNLVSYDLKIKPKVK